MAKHLTIDDGDTIKQMTDLVGQPINNLTFVNDTYASDHTFITFNNNIVKLYSFYDDIEKTHYIPSTSFANDSTLISLVLGENLIGIDLFAFQNCSNLTGSLTIPNSVTTIGSLAFSGCTGFTGSLTIGNSVTTIGGGAFGNCTGFTGSLTIPDSVTSIGTYAFQNCSNLTGSLTIPNSVTTIKDSAFQNCSKLTGSLTIGNSVTSIGDRAFFDCTGFTGSLTIPDSVTSIGEYAFNGCASLQDIYVNADASIWGPFSLNNTGSGQIYVTTGNLLSYDGVGATFQGHEVVEWTSYPDPMP